MYVTICGVSVSASPPWFGKFSEQERAKALASIRQGRYQTAKIKVVDRAPDLTDDDFGGTWDIGPKPANNVTIWVERKLVDSAVKTKQLDVLVELLRHECDEAQIFLNAVRKHWPDADPHDVLYNPKGREQVNLAGWAHEQVVEEHWGKTEGWYFKQLKLERHALGLR